MIACFGSDWTSLDCQRRCTGVNLRWVRLRYWFNHDPEDRYIVGFRDEFYPFQGTDSQNSSAKMSKSPNGIGRLAVVERWPTKEEAVNVRQEFEEEQPAAKIARGFTVDPVRILVLPNLDGTMDAIGVRKSFQKMYRAWYYRFRLAEQRRWLFKSIWIYGDASDGYFEKTLRNTFRYYRNKMQCSDNVYQGREIFYVNRIKIL